MLVKNFHVLKPIKVESFEHFLEIMGFIFKFEIKCVVSFLYILFIYIES